MADGAKVDVSIVMPAYNEEANIEKTVRSCAAALGSTGLSGEIVVVNDGSRDRTLELLKGLELEILNLKVVNHTRNLGYGAALKTAVSESKGEYVVTIDSDGQFDIGELPLFFQPGLNGTGVVTGYRKKKNDTLFRVVANRGLNSLISMLFRVRFNDINCAYRLYRGEHLRSINIESRGYQAPSEIMIKLSRLGCSAKEVGVSHLPREGGQSALRPLRTIAQMTAFLIYLKLKTVLYNKGIINSL